MQYLFGSSLNSNGINWLIHSRHPLVIHVFDRYSKLINECKEVLSVVTAQIGSDPFNLVVENDVLFTEEMVDHSHG